LVPERYAGGGDAFAVGFHALRAHWPLFAAFQLEECLVSLDMKSMRDDEGGTTLRFLHVRLFVESQPTAYAATIHPAQYTHQPVRDLGGILLRPCQQPGPSLCGLQVSVCAVEALKSNNFPAAPDVHPQVQNGKFRTTNSLSLVGDPIQALI
jgi:hypothetical protein